MTVRLLLITWSLLPFAVSQAAPSDTLPAIAEKVKDLEKRPGFFPIYWSEDEGKLYGEVANWKDEFLYVNSLTGGLGSNDLNLDRNQLGDTRIVKWVRSGPKVLLLQPNYRYRAETENEYERQAVEDAFAQSVLWGFRAVARTGDRLLIDLTPFLLRDAHGVARRLKAKKQGTYKADADRSMLLPERIRNFPLNTEMTALVTLTGEPKGSEVRSVAPSPAQLSLRMRHSFIQLPEPGYEPRPFDPRSGYFPVSYYDYATPIDQPLVKRFIPRHRLQKKNPDAPLSEPEEPIVYYLDPGTPEPVRSALLEGARWWAEAFEYAGFRDAFQVELLPEGADPLDVRYNVINWVHRSTRGWSYGSTVIDPRTGEIIKGHVLLGSLRVRQDFLIAQGLIPAYAEGDEADPRLQKMALARLRQLAAHEVGHTLGLAHNFAASTRGRASVMDYPHPYLLEDAQGELDLSQAYDSGIGLWDKRAIKYGYAQFPGNADQQRALDTILAGNQKLNLPFISDPDARPSHSAHPQAHLWDNGTDPVAELERLKAVRKLALQRFGEDNLPTGTPLSELERVLVPLYLMHRYQAEAAAKLVGGLEYSYSVRGDKQPKLRPVVEVEQRKALDALIETLDPEFLWIPSSVSGLIPPPAYSYDRNREYFPNYTGTTFDPLAAAEASAEHTLSLLLDPRRLARLEEQSGRNLNGLSAYELIDELQRAIQRWAKRSQPWEQSLAYMVEKRLVFHLIRLAGDRKVHPQIAGAAWAELEELKWRLSNRIQWGTGIRTTPERAHLVYLYEQIIAFQKFPDQFELPEPPEVPPGAPIGCGGP